MFVAAQGAAVFGTAYLVLRLLKTSHWLAKFFAMLGSYVAWITFTVAGYLMLGGDFGMMDGGLFVFALCLTALISSFAYLLAWTLWGPIAKAVSWRPT